MSAAFPVARDISGSSVVIVSTLRIVCVPETVRFPSTVRSPVRWTLPATVRCVSAFTIVALVTVPLLALPDPSNQVAESTPSPSYSATAPISMSEKLSRRNCPTVPPVTTTWNTKSPVAAPSAAMKSKTFRPVVATSSVTAVAAKPVVSVAATVPSGGVVMETTV